MYIINFLFKTLNNYNEWKITLSLLPILILQYKKDKHSVFCSVFIIFISYMMMFLTKGSLRITHPIYTHTYSFPSGHCWVIPLFLYAFLRSILNDKKKCFIWWFIYSIIEIFICTYGGYHTIIDCLGGAIGCLCSLIIIEPFIKTINYKKVLLVDLCCVMVNLLIFKLAPVYYVNNYQVLVFFGIVANLLYLIQNINNFRK